MQTFRVREHFGEFAAAQATGKDRMLAAFEEIVKAFRAEAIEMDHEDDQGVRQRVFVVPAVLRRPKIQAPGSEQSNEHTGSVTVALEVDDTGHRVLSVIDNLAQGHPSDTVLPYVPAAAIDGVVSDLLQDGVNGYSDLGTANDGQLTLDEVQPSASYPAA